MANLVSQVTALTTWPNTHLSDAGQRPMLNLWRHFKPMDVQWEYPVLCKMYGPLPTDNNPVFNSSA
jgi:hypothetical protein